MGISHYIKEIGRGKDGARSLTREQAQDLLQQILQGSVSDLEVGGFCLAMRIKGETPEELAGFLDAISSHINTVPAAEVPTVVLPSYNGARKLPVLTPLLALLLAQQGMRVVIHGQPSDPKRITSHQVLGELQSLGMPHIHLLTQSSDAPTSASVIYLPTSALSAGLQRLLDVRSVIGLRNSAHSLVKLLNPCPAPSLLVSSYTHPEYLHSMGRLFQLSGAHALLLRGTEGEPVADARRTPQMDSFCEGQQNTVQEAQHGSLTQLPELPNGLDPKATARYIQRVIHGELPVPEPIRLQVNHICQALR
jgi:anthranilate phosphoribosyltransferase